MNKLEYLTRLRTFLERNGLPEEDINDALTYYEEVFMDAGFGKDAETAEALGSPETVGENILKESGIQPNSFSNFNSGFNNSNTNFTNCGPQQNQNIYANQYYNQYDGKSGSNTVLKLIIAILSFPLWFPILITVLALMIAFVCVAFSLLIALIAVSVALVFGGLTMLAEIPSLACMLLGGGLVASGLSLLICKKTFGAAASMTVGLFRKFVSWLRGIFKKGESGEKGYE